MASSTGPRKLFILAAVALAATAAGWLLLRGERTPGPPAATAAFLREAATEVGITFRMHFLPGEQGEVFKGNLYDHGAGLAVGDFDGDGRDDIYFLNQLGENALYRNKGDGTFEDVTAAAGVAVGDRICVAATFVDYDNDGWPDLYVTSTRGGNILFRNLGNGQFRDVTKEAGLTHVGHSQTAVFFDYDNDGWLDLLLTNTAAWTGDAFDPVTRYYPGKDGGGFNTLALSPKEHNVLYRNNGNGTFTDVTAKAGLQGRGWAGDAVAFDYNNDGWPDLFATCMFGRCQLYRNNGNGTFTDVTLEVLGRTSWGAVGAKAFDADNDGRLDLYVLDMHSDMWMGLDWEHRSLPHARKSGTQKFPYLTGPRGAYDLNAVEQEEEFGRQAGFRRDEVVYGNTFYRNQGGGRFTEVSDQAGLETFWPWGVATGDFDNDGFEDAFVPTGMGYPFYYWPNYLLMNQGDGTFRDRAAELGVEPPARGIYLEKAINGRQAARSSRAAAVADFDGDGRLEIVTNNFNDQPYFFKNQFPPRNYVAFRLRGTKSNRDAIGAVVRVYRGDKVLARQVQGAGGYLAQSSRTLHFGLGERPQIDRVEITWPGGALQRLDSFKVNAINDVVEPGGKP